MENNTEKKIPKTKQIVYKYFNDMLVFTNSQYYKNILIKCTRQKFLKGFVIEVINRNDEKVYVIKTKFTKKKNSNYRFIEIVDGTYQSYLKFIDFLKNNDIYEFNNLLNLKQPDIPTLWSKLKTNVKKKYLAEYTFEKCGGNMQQSKTLYSKIIYGLLMGYIQNSDIVIDNRSIILIKNIRFENNDIEFTIPDKIMNMEIKEVEKSQIMKTSVIWQKYLSGLIKKSDNDNEEDMSLYEREIEY